MQTSSFFSGLPGQGLIFFLFRDSEDKWGKIIWSLMYKSVTSWRLGVGTLPKTTVFNTMHNACHSETLKPPCTSWDHQNRNVLHKCHQNACGHFSGYIHGQYNRTQPLAVLTVKFHMPLILALQERKELMHLLYH